MIHHSFIWHLLKENSEHMNGLYSSIYGKEIYPVAVFDFTRNAYYVFESKAKYYMVR